MSGSVKRAVRYVLFLGSVGLSTVLYNNCAGGLPSDPGVTGVTNSSVQTLKIDQVSVNANTATQLSASGGTPPYRFEMVAGSATVSATGQILGPAGPVIVQVTDNVGRIASLAINIAGVATVGFRNCTTPWGTTLAHGASVTAFQAASAVCPSSCQSQTRTCNDGVLSGTMTSPSCSAVACEYKLIQTSYGADCSIGNVSQQLAFAQPSGACTYSEGRCFSTGGMYHLYQCLPANSNPTVINIPYSGWNDSFNNIQEGGASK